MICADFANLWRYLTDTSFDSYKRLTTLTKTKKMTTTTTTAKATKAMMVMMSKIAMMAMKATMATMAIVAPWNFYGGCARCVGKGTEAAQKKNGRPLIPFLSFRFPYFDSLSMSSRFLFVGKPISRRSVRRSGHVSLQT